MAQMTVFIPAPDQAYAELVFSLYQAGSDEMALEFLTAGLIQATREGALEYIERIESASGEGGDVYEYFMDVPEYFADSIDLLRQVGLTISE